MRMIIAFLTLSLVVCLTLCSNENRKEDDKDEFLEEILDREKRDAMPQPRGNIYLFICLFVLVSQKILNLFGIQRTRIWLNRNQKKLNLRYSLRILAEFYKIYTQQKPLELIDNCAYMKFNLNST